MTEVVPVTKDQMTQTEINYSIKVGKQVIKKQLEKEISEVQVQLELLRVSMLAEFNGSNFARWIENEAEIAVEGHPAITTLRNTMGMMLNDVKLETNMDLFNGHCDSSHIVSRVHGESFTPRGNELEFINEMLNSGVVETSFEFAFTIQDENNSETPEMVFEIQLSEEWKQKLKNYHDSKVERYKLAAEIHEKSQKLSKLDEVMEEVEATILANELRQSESGRKVLEISAGIIGGVLGTTPELLTINKE